MRALLSHPRTIALALVGTSALTSGCSPPPPAPLQGPVATQTLAVLDGVEDGTPASVVGIRVDEKRICSGTLIAPNLVLTARHCVSRDELSAVRCGEGALGPPLDAGRLKVTTENNTQDATWLSVAEVWLASGDDDVCGNDIALLLLDASVDQSVTPFTPYISQNVGDAQPYTAVGYGGNTIDGSNVGVRRVAYDFKVTCVGTGCVFSDIFRANEWRGGGAAGKYVCHGDSGGPAVIGNGYVAGVLSRLLFAAGSDACGTPVYTSTYAWAGFLQTRAVRAAVIGGYRLPDWARGGGGLPDELRFGNTCESNIDCSSNGTCVFDGTQGYCSYDCDDTTACPGAGYECNKNVGICLALASTPDKISCFGNANLCSNAKVVEQVNDEGSCSLAGGPKGRANAGAWLVGLVALIWHKVRQKRTT